MRELTFSLYPRPNRKEGCRLRSFKCEDKGVYQNVNDRSPSHEERAPDAPLSSIWWLPLLDSNQRPSGLRPYLRFGGSPCWTRTNDLAVNSRSLLPTELRRNIQFSFFCGSRSPLATSGPLVATRFSLYAKISASLALGFGLFRHTVSKLNAVAPTELRRNIRFSLF